MTKNGICTKTGTDGFRIHKIEQVIDGQGRSYSRCERCGTMFV